MTTHHTPLRLALPIAPLLLLACIPPSARRAPSTEAEVVRVRHPTTLSSVVVQGPAFWSAGGTRRESRRLVLRAAQGRLEVREGASWRRASSVTIRPKGEVLEWGGMRTSGQLGVVASGSRLVMTEQVPIEDYVAGVVAAEMGSAGRHHPAALEAQAILARTYAIKNRGKYPGAGYDMYASSRDQAYRGIPVNAEPFLRAARATRGVVLVDGDGALADVFYHSTCGGVTERGADVFSGADRPYLQSVEDVDPMGRAYCSLSPRFEWTVRLRPSDAASLVRGLREIEVTRITSSGRLAEVGLRGPGGQARILTGQDIRNMLRPGGQPLQSLAATIARSGDSWSITGNGWGHGVGMCQYGAIGRAIQGASAEEILAAYFPGTVTVSR